MKLKLRLQGYKPCPAYSAEGLATRMGRTSPPVPEEAILVFNPTPGGELKTTDARDDRGD